MHILILKFHTNQYEQLLNDLPQLAEWMNSLPGLQSKTWLQDKASQQIGGIYHFDTEENLLSYKNSPELHQFKQQYSITDYQEMVFDTNEVDAASKINHSPYT